MSVHPVPDLRYDRNRTAIITILGLVLAVAVLTCLYFYFNSTVNAAPLNTSVATIYSNPKGLVGRNVIVSGTVGSVLNSGAFTVVDPNAAPTSQVLVISKSPIPPVPNRPDNPGLL